MPFDARDDDGLLTLTLDTPGSAVNIFNRETAHQLTAILGAVDPARTRAIVFRTAKRNSFINGVGLLLAHAARTRDDVVAASAPARAAYRAVRESKVPTVAVIEGSCWGCGVEFALQCDYRIASDADNTQLYMTEVNDYLFLPLFGSTWNLPAVVGLEAAIDFLLFGERWGAARALARGLVDAVLPAETIATRGAATARAMAARPRPERRAAFGPAEEAIAAHAAARLDDLPPSYRVIYEGALDLLVRGARRATTVDAHMERELALSAESAIAELGKAAFGFFYLRQMAADLSGSGRVDAAVRLDVAGPGGAPMLAEIARGRYVARERGEERRVEACDATCAPRAGVVAAIDGVVDRVPERWEGWDALAYAPLWSEGVRFVEIHVRRGDGPSALASAFAAHLGRAHAHVALARAGEDFASNRILRAFLAPIAAFIARGGDGDAVDDTLRRAGFTRRPRTWATLLGPAALAAVLRAPEGDMRAFVAGLAPAGATPPPRDRDRSHAALWAAIAVSLLAAYDDGAAGFAHTVMADLAARELLGFPLGRTSLASYLKTREVAALLDRVDPSLIHARDVARARAFVARGKEFYR